jgi:hypothetical protein
VAGTAGSGGEVAPFFALRTGVGSTGPRPSHQRLCLVWHVGFSQKVLLLFRRLTALEFLAAPLVVRWFSPCQPPSPRATSLLRSYRTPHYIAFRDVNRETVNASAFSAAFFLTSKCLDILVITKRLG